MFFWLKNTVYIITLLIILFYVWINEDTLFSSIKDKSTAKYSSNSSISKIKPMSGNQSNAPSKSQSDTPSKGLTKFYANLIGHMNTEGPTVRNNIVYLPKPKGDLVELLAARKLIISPLRQNWHGDVDNRAFRTGDTLHQKLVEYADKEGIEVIWWLNKDLIVKEPFRITTNLLETAYRIGKAVEGHFQNGVNIYFCYQQRNIVLIDQSLPYLTKECLLLHQE